MDRPPYFAFYPADFANDIHVEAMSTLQVGAYVLLLCKAWQADPPASLPNDDQILARFARVDAAVWQEIKAGVLVPFRLGTDKRLHSKRLRLEYDEALKRMKANRSKAQTAARVRWGPMPDACLEHAPSMPGAVLEQCLSNATEMETKTKTEEIRPPQPPAKPGGERGAHSTKPRRRKDGPEPHPLFDRFWAAYPHKTAKAFASKVFARIDPDEALLARMLAALEWQAKSEQWLKESGLYIPHPATWLNAKRWEDEPPAGGRPPLRAADVPPCRGWVDFGTQPPLSEAS